MAGFLSVVLEEIARASEEIAATRSRLKKVELLGSILRRLPPPEVSLAVAYLSGVLPQGSIGVGWAALRELPAPARAPGLEITEVDSAFTTLLATVGAGSQAVRRGVLADLFGRATETEQRFLVALLLGELRQGALEGVMADAIAKATELPASDVRRAAMLAGDLGAVAATAVGEGRAGLARFRLTLFRPILPMLAGSAADIDAAFRKVRSAGVEWKLDGARIQVHREGSEVRVYTRKLAEVTARVPEVVSAVMDLPVDSIVLDGEVIALRPGGSPYPFQTTMSRFGSRTDVDRQREAVPLSTFFFDCLHVDSDDMIDLPLAERAAILAERLPAGLLAPRIVTEEPEQASAFLDDALAKGHEGVMVKSLEAPYEAGRRGSGWLKVKRAHTLDLVVLAAEWGHGRRRGRLSNLHLGARDERGGFVMLGKTFKGMTDEMLEWQTEHLLELETGREGITVHVRPELVVEVAFDGLQASHRYPGGIALRFARIKGYRHDKSALDADSIETVRALHRDATATRP
jgi:ATP-dependent DNA ligase I